MAPALVYSVLALLIEVCAVAALVLPGEYLLAVRGGGFRTSTHTRADREPVEAPSSSEATSENLNSDLAQALQSGAVQPSYRAIAKYLRCRHAKAKEAAQALIQQGVLQPNGNGLQLT